MDDPEFYRAFEDRFRGSRHLIRSRLEVYLPFVKPLVEASQGTVAKALDLGCGRGEWLELLTEAGVDPKGVDTNDEMLAGCTELGLSVENKDALAALAETESESQLVVSAIHVAEHLEFNKLLDVVKQAHRVLVPGGLLILETPNPENPIVSAVGFHLDPTHLKPLPPPLLGFAVEYCGFSRHLLMKLQEDKDALTDTRVTLFQVLSASSPDYAIVAQKTGPDSYFEAIGDSFEKIYGVSLADVASSYDGMITGELKQQQDAIEDVHTKLARKIEEGAAEFSVEQDRKHAELTSLYNQQNNDIADLKMSLKHQKLLLDECHGKIADQISSMDVRVSGLEASIRQLSKDVMGILNTPVQRLLLRLSGKRFPDTDQNPDQQ